MVTMVVHSSEGACAVIRSETRACPRNHNVSVSVSNTKRLIGWNALIHSPSIFGDVVKKPVEVWVVLPYAGILEPGIAVAHSGDRHLNEFAAFQSLYGLFAQPLDGFIGGASFALHHHRKPGAGSVLVIGTMPAATAAAEPPLEPPGECAVFHGLRVGPHASGSVVGRLPNSGLFVRPAVTKPGGAEAARRASCRPGDGSAASFSARLPLLSVCPCVAAHRSLSRNGTPRNGPSGSGPAADARGPRRTSG